MSDTEPQPEDVMREVFAAYGAALLEDATDETVSEDES